MKLTLSDRDRAIIRSMRTVEALEDLDGHRLNPEGIVLVTCPDADQYADIYGYTAGLFESCHNCKPRIHALGCNGGPLRLPKKSTLNERGSSTSKDLMKDIAEALIMKGLDTVVLLSHVPCGKATRANLDFIKTASLTFMAKVQIKRTIETIRVRVPVFFQVDYGNIKRTYFMSAASFATWCATHGNEFFEKDSA